MQLTDQNTPMTAPNIHTQLIQEHASLIVEVVEACNHPERQAQFLEDLKIAEQNGWGNLCAAIRKILAGSRSHDELENLDVEDEAIVDAIFLGLEDPANLPDPFANQNPMLAPAGLAGVIATAATGEENALQLLARMDTDLQESPIPELQQFGQILRRLLNGERNVDALTLGMDERMSTLVTSVLEELDKLDN